jgi:hypothetical protein
MAVINMKHARAIAALAILALAACSGSGTSPVSPTQQNLNANILQLAVGTANIYGTSTGLNVAVTYRQPHGALSPGLSGTAVNTPTFTSPAAFPASAGTPDGFFSTIESGPAPTELGTHNMVATSQTGSQPTTFGRSGGAFALGLEPFNYNSTGSPDSITPYCQPMYNPGTASDCYPVGSGVDPNIFTPWGGPPAFPNQRGVSNAGQLGQEEGLNVFLGVTPVAGPYTLAISVPANSGTVSVAANAGLANASLVLPIVAPLAPILDGNGGATIKLAHGLSGGITEAYVQVVDYGPPTGVSCNGSGTGQSGAAFPTFYTLLFKPGMTSQSLPDAFGPGGSPTLCTSAQNTSANTSSSGPFAGDTFTVQGIGFDYPWYEATPPNAAGRNPAPAILGPGSQSDISISPALSCTQSTSNVIACAVSSSSGLRTRHGSVRKTN